MDIHILERISDKYEKICSYVFGHMEVNRLLEITQTEIRNGANEVRIEGDKLVFYRTFSDEEVLLKKKALLMDEVYKIDEVING